MKPRVLVRWNFKGTDYRIVATEDRRVIESCGRDAAGGELWQVVVEATYGYRGSEHAAVTPLLALVDELTK